MPSSDIQFKDITDNSVVLFWDYPTDVGGNIITGYRLTVKNQDTGQTISAGTINARSQLIGNLKPSRNYRAYLIVISSGPRPETFNDFKTLGVAVVTPPIIISAEVQTILNKFDNNDYEYPYTDLPVLINLVRNGYLSNNNFLITINQLLDQKTIIDKTIIISPVVTPPIIISAEVQTILNKFDNNNYTYPTWFNSNIGFVKDGSITSNEFLNSFNSLLQNGTIVDKTIVIIKEYDVNTYRINEFGGVYNEIIYGIDGNRLLQLEAEFLVTLVGSPTPSDQEVKDFYNYIDVDTSVKTTMVEQRFLEFKIVNGYVQGKINHVATQFFTDYWRSKTIYSIIKIDDSNGNPILLGNEPKQSQKVNELRFNQDDFEQITINEYVGDIPAITITSYVWDKINLNSNPQAFSGVKTLQVVKDDPDGKTCPTGYHLGFNGKCVLDGGEETGGATSIIGKALGFTALLGTLALLGAKRR